MAEELRQTPDGIARVDWDRVHQLAVDIVTASASDDANTVAQATRQLHAVLDELEARYGRLPTIVATRADYLDDPGQQEQALLEAYRLAEAGHDGRKPNVDRLVFGSLVSRA
jgi:hypothetical protein